MKSDSFWKKPAEATKAIWGNSGLVNNYVTHSLLAKLIGKIRWRVVYPHKDENKGEPRMQLKLDQLKLNHLNGP